MLITWSHYFLLCVFFNSISKIVTPRPRPSVKFLLYFSHLKNKIPLSLAFKAAASFIFYIPELLLSRSASISTMLNLMTSSQSSVFTLLDLWAVFDTVYSLPPFSTILLHCAFRPPFPVFSLPQQLFFQGLVSWSFPHPWPLNCKFQSSVFRSSPHLHLVTWLHADDYQA